MKERTRKYIRAVPPNFIVVSFQEKRLRIRIRKRIRKRIRRRKKKK